MELNTKCKNNLDMKRSDKNEKYFTKNIVDLITKQVGIGFQTSVWGLKKTRYTKNSFPSGVSRFVARKITSPADKSCSSSMNGSDLEQISHNRVVRLPLEVAKIWNKLFDEVI